MIDKIRIKDIALEAGVSVGTVDRVLHNRPNVSKSAREKVENVLKEINYQPNMYASALAYNKQYTFYVIMPEHDSEAYWEEVEEGVEKSCVLRRDFHIDTDIVYYKLYDQESYAKAFETVLASEPNGVVIVPTDLESTRQYTDELHERNIPFILLDSYIPDLQPLSFYGQDSFRSGAFAARMLMLLLNGRPQGCAPTGDTEIMLMKQTKNGIVASRQQMNREIGFRLYMQQSYPSVNILEVDLPLDEDRSKYDTILEDFFTQHPNVRQCITMCSKAHIVGDFLSRSNRRNVQIMGYDMVGKNEACLRNGSISFLIAQHAFVQGFHCIDSLFRAVVLKQEIAPTNFMPIELLTKENVDFYRKAQM